MLFGNGAGAISRAVLHLPRRPPLPVARRHDGFYAPSHIEVADNFHPARAALLHQVLEALGVSAGDVNRALRAANVDLTGGSADFSGRDQAIRTRPTSRIIGDSDSDSDSEADSDSDGRGNGKARGRGKGKSKGKGRG